MATFRFSAIMAPLLLASSCAQDAMDSSPVKLAPEYEKSFTAGPVSLILRVDKTSIQLSDRIRLEQELRVDPGFEADFPEYLPEDFDGFAVVDIRTEGDFSPSRSNSAPSDSGPSGAGSASTDTATTKPPAATRRIKQLILEPDRSGSLAIEPFEVYFHASGEAQESSFATEPVPIEVAAFENISELDVHPARDIFHSPPAEETSHALEWIVGGLGALTAFVGLLWFFVFRTKPEIAIQRAPPHETAWENLRRLIALDLVARGEIEKFFVGLSSILRQYIEERFHVRAPEQTTQEFFEAVERASALTPYRDRLRQFLDLADQVKFARFEPDKTSIQSSFDVLKKFIEETTDHES